MFPTLATKVVGMQAGEDLRSSWKQRIRDIRLRLGLVARPTKGLKRAALPSSDYEEVFSSDMSEVLAHWDQRRGESPAKRPRRDKQRIFPITNPRTMLNRGSQVVPIKSPPVKDFQKVLSGIATSPGFKIYEDYEDFQTSGQGSSQSPPPPLPPRKPHYCLPPPLPRDRLGSSSVRQAHLALRREAILRNLENENPSENPNALGREIIFSDLDSNFKREPIVLRREAILRNLERNRLRRLHQMARTPDGKDTLWETPASA